MAQLAKESTSLRSNAEELVSVSGQVRSALEDLTRLTERREDTGLAAGVDEQAVFRYLNEMTQQLWRMEQLAIHLRDQTPQA
jgi:hypothetical protein